MTGRDRKRGQVAIFLVLILAGLALLFALNVDVFVSSRAKIRLQNAADASALALARWQGITLNLIGDLNLAHLAAVCDANTNAIKGIVDLQRQIAKIGPLIGLKEANALARENNVPKSDNMTRVFQLISSFVDDEYRRMLDVVSRDGIYAGLDNVKIPDLGPLANPAFYEAVKNRDFRSLCTRFGGNKHQLPIVGTDVPSLEELFSEDEALFGTIGLKWENGNGYENKRYNLANFAYSYGIDTAVVSPAKLKKNEKMFTLYPWSEYDSSEWKDSSNVLSSQFPWIRPICQSYSVMGGGCTIRIENNVPLLSIAAQTNFIVAQAAAKAFGSYIGTRVTDVSPQLILPSFSFVRLVPFSWGANERYGLADYKNISSFPSNNSNNISEYQRILDLYNSDDFRAAAEAWYSNHGHNDADGCCPPSKGSEQGGGASPGV